MNGRRPSGAGRFRLAVLFVVLLLAFGLGIWGTVLRPPAYEVRGVVAARPAPGMLLIRHEAVAALGMSAMELMAVTGDPVTIDAARVAPGDPVRVAVRRRDEEIVLIRIDKLR